MNRQMQMTDSGWELELHVDEFDKVLNVDLGSGSSIFGLTKKQAEELAAKLSHYAATGELQ